MLAPPADSKDTTALDLCLLDRREPGTKHHFEVNSAADHRSNLVITFLTAVTPLIELWTSLAASSIFTASCARI